MKTPEEVYISPGQRNLGVSASGIAEIIRGDRANALQEIEDALHNIFAGAAYNHDHQAFLKAIRCIFRGNSMTCPHCGYEWTPRVGTPPEVP